MTLKFKLEVFKAVVSVFTSFEKGAESTSFLAKLLKKKNHRVHMAFGYEKFFH